MLNYIWMGMMVLGVAFGLLNGRAGELSQAFLDWSEKAVMGVALPLAGMFTLMLGLMRLVEKSGLITVIARFCRPVLRRLFPDVPPEHPAMGAMVMNIASNFLGAGNAATPFGLRAMAQLDTLNPHPGTATNAMCTFLVLNTSALTLISTTGLVLLKKAGSSNPTAVIAPSIAATVAGLLVGLIVLRICQHLPMFAARPVTSGENRGATDRQATDEPEAEAPVPAPHWSGGRWLVLAAFAAIVVAGGAVSLVKAGAAEAFTAGGIRAVLPVAMTVVSSLVMPAFLTFFIVYAAVAGVKVFEEFIEGAKEGMQTVIRIIPYLVAMIVAIGVLRASGLIDGLAWLLKHPLHVPGAIPDLLPMILMRPLSGAGSSAVLTDLLQRFGADSYEGLAAATMYGSTETTFYVLALYFGSVGIRRVRHALLAGLLAEAAAMVTAMVLAQWLVDA